MNLPEVKTVLTLAGSDPSGGAGVQADLKTFAAHNIFGTSVIASITSQNTVGVQNAFHLPPEVVERQLKSVFEDQKPSAVKTGMLGDAALVETAARLLKRYRARNLVVDPVIRSSSGKTLLSPKGVQALKELLLPLATLVTPNLKEAEILSGVRIKRPADRIKAARAILKTGVKQVLITGGHLRGDPEDLLFSGGKPILLGTERIGGEDFHGTGCVFSAAIAANLAQGENVIRSVRSAKNFVSSAILGGVRSGKGIPCVDPMYPLYQSRERYDLFCRMSAAIEALKEARIGHLIPEVQSNMAVGMERARSLQDVLGIPGRIVKMGDDIVTLSPPQFGASRHVADIVLTVMNFDPTQRAVMNIKYDESVLRACQSLKFKVGSFDRGKEPKKVREKEGSSLEWGTAQAIGKLGFVPDIIYDLGGVGKEEMIRVIAEDVERLVDKVLRIHRRRR